MSAAACMSPRGSDARSAFVPRTMATALIFFLPMTAAAVLGGDVAVVTLDGCEAREVLPRGPDRVHREHVAAQAELRTERVLGRPRVLAEAVAGIAELHDVVVDVEISPVPRVPLDDDPVVAR